MPESHCSGLAVPRGQSANAVGWIWCLLKFCFNRPIHPLSSLTKDPTGSNLELYWFHEWIFIHVHSLQSQLKNTTREPSLWRSEQAKTRACGERVSCASAWTTWPSILGTTGGPCESVNNIQKNTLCCAQLKLYPTELWCLLCGLARGIYLSCANLHSIFSKLSWDLWDTFLLCSLLINCSSMWLLLQSPQRASSHK